MNARKWQWVDRAAVFQCSWPGEKLSCGERMFTWSVCKAASHDEGSQAKEKCPLTHQIDAVCEKTYGYHYSKSLEKFTTQILV